MIAQPEAIEPEKRAQAEKLGYTVALVDVHVDGDQKVTRKYALLSPEGEVIASDFDSPEAALELLPADLKRRQIAVIVERFEGERALLLADLARRYDEALGQVEKQFESNGKA